MNDTARWSYLTLGTIVMLFLGMLYAWTIFRAPLSAMFNTWTVSQMSLTFSISMIMFCGGSIAGGKLSAIFAGRIIFLLSAALLFTGFFGVSLTLNPDNPSASLMALYGFYGISCGLGVGIGYNCLMSTLLKWFPDRTGLASGVLLMGFGFGGLVLGSVINSLASNLGLVSTFQIIATGTAAVLIFSAWLIKKPDESALAKLALLMNHSSSKRKIASAPPTIDYTSSQMLTSAAFWVFFLWLICICSGGLLVINSAAPIAVAFGAPAIMGLIVSLFNGGGRVFYGMMFDRYGSAITLTLNASMLLLSGVFLLAAAKTGSSVFMYIGLPLVGLSFGGAPAITSVTVNAVWGSKYYPANFGLANCSLIPAAFIGPMITSALQERSGGNYDSTFLMLISFGVLALLLGLPLIKRLTKSAAAN